MTSVLAIGYGRQIFDEKHSERRRIEACARVVHALHMIVFSEKKHTCVPVHADPLFIHPTDSRSRMHMLLDAYKIGSSVLRNAGVKKRQSAKAKEDQWIVSAQDPFEAGLVGYLLHLRYHVRLQVQEHGDFFGGMSWRRERLLNRARYLFGKWLLRRAGCVRAVSVRVAQHLVAVGVNPLRISILAVASDTVAFREARPIPKEHDLRVRYPDAETIILAVGRLVKEKNLALLIRAFRGVVEAYPRARLVIVGSGPEEAALRGMVGVSGLSARVSLLPWTNDVASYMHSADIFALSSYREGWGRVILEAMAAGLPGVVTDVGCVGEVFIHDRHGIVVPVDDTEAFQKALQMLIADPQRRRQCGTSAAHDSALFIAQQKPYAEMWLETIHACGGVYTG